MDYQIEWLNRGSISLWILALICFLTYLVLRRRRSNLPPGPRGLPIVGYLPFLGNEPHLKLHKLSKQYGDIFGLYLGTTYVVVVADYAAAKELLSKSSTADRPERLFQFLPDGGGLGELNGPEWVEQRRYTMQKMKNMGFGRSHWEKLVQTEVQSFLDFISQFNGQPMDIYKTVSASISNNVLSLVWGHRLPLGDPKRDLVDTGIESFMSIYTQSGLITFFPKLFKIAVNLGLIRAGDMLEKIAEMNKYFRQSVDELKQADDKDSYVCEYLKEIEKNKALNSRSSYNSTNLIGNMQALILAGSETTQVSLRWLFLAMASFPDVQAKVHRELDSILGEEEVTLVWMDRFKLPYCQATIMEGQRWRTIVPLNLLHRTNSDTAIRDYVIPKGSNIITLLWAFHNNDRYWTNPEAFRPERFLDQEGKVAKNIENYAPFSIGKRLCIGETVAYIELFLYFVGVMKRFQILPASEDTTPDLKGSLGLTLQPSREQLRFVPR